MAKRLTMDKMLKAGFVLEDCPDGRFWVIDREPGEEADRVAAICRLYLEDMDSAKVGEELVLQCDCVFREPALYVDGFMWNLAPRDFSHIVARLAKRRGKLPRILIWPEKHKDQKEQEKGSEEQEKGQPED